MWYCMYFKYKKLEAPSSKKYPNKSKKNVIIFLMLQFHCIYNHLSDILFALNICWWYAWCWYAKGKPKSIKCKVFHLPHYHLKNSYLFTHVSMNSRTQYDGIAAKSLRLAINQNIITNCWSRNDSIQSNPMTNNNRANEH